MDIRQLFDIMVDQDASDLYITSNAKPTIRAEGTLKPISKSLLTGAQTKQIAYELMDDEQIKEFENTSEMNLAHATDRCRYRVNIFRQRGDVGLVIRTIQIEIPSMDSLHLPVKVLRELSMKKRGLILFVGATSSGKSTSLASMIDYRNANAASHIITIEDPMEYVHPNKMSLVEQREVGFDTLSYENALKNTLRQAPDVILIGEIRSADTMEHAIAFAETGHLCLSTLHANNANQAIDRILSFFPNEYHERTLLELSLNLQGIISQRLIPTKDGKRLPAIEILLGSPLVKDLIMKGEVTKLKEVMEKSNLIGMQSFDQALFTLYDEGHITYDDALANSDSPNNLRLKIKLKKDADELEQQEREAEENEGRIEMDEDGRIVSEKEKAKKNSKFSLEKSDDNKKDSGRLR